MEPNNVFLEFLIQDRLLLTDFAVSWNKHCSAYTLYQYRFCFLFRFISTYSSWTHFEEKLEKTNRWPLCSRNLLCCNDIKTFTYQYRFLIPYRPDTLTAEKRCRVFVENIGGMEVERFGGRKWENTKGSMLVLACNVIMFLSQIALFHSCAWSNPPFISSCRRRIHNLSWMFPN